ncbi:hypothetical protein D9756_004135 [Leucocoprinus leucothites]|uniref:Uncharacterized protein n=1 Tax=Leucocoprinus leucothites TaxID=201217 RepID=A0A8H5D9D0_9AGAR|nr:hypothetical protein D9756_004135 [Leucoagaricus leucothites]
MGENAQPGHIRIVGAFAGLGSGSSWAWVDAKKPNLIDLVSFDTVKTRMQCSPPGTYRGALDVLSKIVRNEGVLALYKGATPPAVGWAAIDSVLLGSLHNYRLFFLRQGMIEPHPVTGRLRLTLLGHGFAGLFAGLTRLAQYSRVRRLAVDH